jgi:hypothetical protein
MFFTHDLKLGRAFRVLAFAAYVSVILMLGAALKQGNVLKSAVVIVIIVLMRFVSLIFALLNLRTKSRNFAFCSIVATAVLLLFWILSQAVKIKLILLDKEDPIERTYMLQTVICILFELVIWDFIIQPPVMILIT